MIPLRRRAATICVGLATGLVTGTGAALVDATAAGADIVCVDTPGGVTYAPVPGNPRTITVPQCPPPAPTAPAAAKPAPRKHEPRRAAAGDRDVCRRELARQGGHYRLVRVCGGGPR